MLGGPHPTFLPNEVLLQYCVDVVVRGEGEETLKELVEKYSKYRKIVPIKGISYRRGREVIHCPPRGLIQPLDKIPPPA